MRFFGCLLVLASGIEIAQAVMVGHWAGFFHHLLAAILFGIVGAPGMGLAGGRRPHHAGIGRTCPGAMACIGALGDRSVHRD